MCLQERSRLAGAEREPFALFQCGHMVADPNNMEGKMRNHITTLELAGTRFNPETTGGSSVKLRRTVDHEKRNPPRGSRGFKRGTPGISGCPPSRLPVNWFVDWWRRPPGPASRRSSADPTAETGIRI